MLLHGPSVGSEASELEGSAQDSPCLLGPHEQGLCSDTEALGDAGSSSCGRHRRLSIRGGGVSRVHPGGCDPSLKVGEKTHVAPSVQEPLLALADCGQSHG